MLFADPVSRVEGLDIYRDYSNPLVYYYLPPEAPRVANVAGEDEGGDLAFRLVVYRRDPNRPVAEGLEDGGGFLNLDVDLRLPPAQHERALKKLREKFGSQAELLPVPFTDGSVELVLLAQRQGAEEATPFVRSIQGSSKPSLYGDLRAAFSSELTRDGAALMEAVVRKRGLTLALAQYHLTYVAMSPAYNLEITIDYSRAQEVLDLRAQASFNSQSSTNNSNSSSGNITTSGGAVAGSTSDSSSTNTQVRTGVVGRAGFHLLMEELKEKRAVVVKEVNFVPGEPGQVVSNQERINEIIANLMGSNWFKPTLGQPSAFANIAGAAGSVVPSTNPTGTTTNPTGTTTNPTGTTTNPTGTTTNPTGTTTNPTGTTTNPTGTATNPGTTPPLTTRPNATWTTNDTSGSVTVTPATTGNDEVLVITGTPTSVKANGNPVTVTGGRATVTVPPGESRNIEVTYAGTAPAAEAWFDIFFAFDHPEDPEMASYSRGEGNRLRPTRTGDSTGTDTRFTTSSGPRSGADRDGAHGSGGLAGLQAWLAANPGTLDITAHASWEANPGTGNQGLSERRWRVAQSLVGARAAGLTMTPQTAQGHTRAQTANRNNNENDRIAEIHAAATPAGQPRVVTGTLARANAGSSTTPTGTVTNAGTTNRSTSTDLQVGFSIDLEVIKREERTTATYLLNTEQARKQEIHPAGQLALEFDDDELSKYLLEADLAIAFFERVTVNASTTALWDLDGVEAVRVEIRYAPLGNDWRKRAELILRKDSATASWQVFTERVDPDDPDSAPILGYEYRVVVHFRPEVTLGSQGSEASSVGAPGADAEGWIPTFARNLVINPRDLTAIIPVRIAAGRLRFDIVQQAQVRVAYGAAASMVQLDKDHREQVLVFRPDPGVPATLETSGTLFYADGAQVSLPPRSWSERLLIINEPADAILRVRVILADPNNLYKEAIVTLGYEHGERRIEETLHLSGHAAIQEWAVRLEDPAARDWTWQAVLVSNSGGIEETPVNKGEDTNLIVGFPAKKVQEVDITLLAALPMGDVIGVKLELEYRDDANGVFWERDFLFRQGVEPTATWFIAQKDPAKTTYRHRMTLYRASGATEGPWLESESRQLVLFPG